MRNSSVILIILSLLFIVLPITQQIIRVKQDNKRELITKSIPEASKSNAEYGDLDMEDIVLAENNPVEFGFFELNKSINIGNDPLHRCKEKLDSPPPQT